MAIDLRSRVSNPQQMANGRTVRFFTRAAMLGAIVILALFQGYSMRSWLLVGGAVVWAASLPFLLRFLARQLATVEALTLWQRRLILVAAAIVLLGGFAFGVRLLLPA